MLVTEDENAMNMKTFLISFLRVWVRGIGVLVITGVLSTVYDFACTAVEGLPVLGIPLFILLVPPLLYYAFRWIYPPYGRSTSESRQ